MYACATRYFHIHIILMQISHAFLEFALGKGNNKIISDFDIEVSGEILKKLWILHFQ